MGFEFQFRRQMMMKRTVYMFIGILIISLAACAPVINNETGGLNNSLRSRTAIMPDAEPQPAEGDMLETLDFQYNVQAIEYGNCTFLYGVQPGDSLEEIAQITDTTVNFVLTQNDLDNEDDLFPGLVLCLETGENGFIIPPTGVRSGVEVTEVSSNQSVTVRGMNFPEGESVNVFMFQRGVSNPNIVRIGSITIPTDGTFERTFQIPAVLQTYRNLIIRFRNPDENVSASTTFFNANVDRVTPQECAEYYTVRSGDVLGVIALDVNVSVERLVEINNLVDANLVLPGQMLCIALQ